MMEMKPHHFRELVNDLRVCSNTYGKTQQLREQLARTLSVYITAAHPHIADDQSRVTELQQQVSILTTQRDLWFEKAQDLEAANKKSNKAVVLPAGYSTRAGHPINEGERTVMIPKDGGRWLSRFDVEHALRVAGVTIQEETTPVVIAPAPAEPLKLCAAARDGECHHAECPQLRDNEPKATGRHCPIDNWDEE